MSACVPIICTALVPEPGFANAARHSRCPPSPSGASRWRILSSANCSTSRQLSQPCGVLGEEWQALRAAKAPRPEQWAQTDAIWRVNSGGKLWRPTLAVKSGGELRRSSVAVKSGNPLKRARLGVDKGEELDAANKMSLLGEHCGFPAINAGNQLRRTTPAVNSGGCCCWW